MPKKILPYLITHTPKIFYFFIKLKDKVYKELVDLSNIYALSDDKRKLVLKLSESDLSKDYRMPEIGFAIGRGESFQDRFLSYNGWQRNEFYFPIIEKQEASKTAEKPEKAVKKDDNKLKTCPHCSAILQKDYNYCPYCKILIEEIKDEVDIIL